MLKVDTTIHHTLMCLIIPLNLVRDVYKHIMHNVRMQVLDNLYALADNSRRDPRRTRHHN